MLIKPAVYQSERRQDRGESLTIIPLAKKYLAAG